MTSARASIDSSKIRSGLIWNILQALGNQFSKFAVKVVLARLLVPEDFGLIGMAVVFTGVVATVNELGMSAGLIQRKEESLTEIHYSTVFYFSFIISIFLYLITSLVLAPFVASFYNKPELQAVVAVISLPLLLSSISLISRARLNKELRFRELGIVSLTSLVGSGVVAVILAYSGFGVWALAWQGVSSAIISSGMSFYYAPWIPRSGFSVSALKDIFSFSAFVALNNVSIYFTKNIDYFFVGRMVGAYDLGLYTAAFTLSDMARNQGMGILNKVLFPIYSRAQDDIRAIKANYLNVIRLNSIVLVPGLAGIACTAEPILRLVFGDRWVGAAPALSILAISTIIHVLGGASSTMLTAIGKSRLDFSLFATTSICITCPLIYLGVRFGGIEGCALGVAIGKLVSVATRQLFVGRLIGMTWEDFFRSNYRGIMGASLVGIVYAGAHWLGVHIAIAFSLSMAFGYGCNAGIIYKDARALMKLKKIKVAPTVA